MDRTDWTPEEALRFYADQRHYDVVEGRTRIIDTGAVASNALKHVSLSYANMKGDVALSESKSTIITLQAQLAERDATLLEQQANFEQFMQLFCGAADNIGDLPISEEWAEQWYSKATALLDKTNFGRHGGALESALASARLAGKIEGLEEAAYRIDGSAVCKCASHIPQGC